MAKPLGLSDREVQDAIQKARDQLPGGKLAGTLPTGAQLLVQWAAAVILILVLTFYFLKDGEQLRDWTVCLFAEQRAACCGRSSTARGRRSPRTCRACSSSRPSTRC